ncbi:uncharacterized protein F5891DRAFT_1130398 [Suillus fuscotomentosus]|uniref:Uncharacterized protein n=1 Tax=Suillus fuscotomentosus TaxID=1912939 RepID=A0AAD4HH17_9AGAM|nr:uncharacterized protein F5891DRAFT_1130398 [Suillus fuscotomentosus]KAG1896202.1 hypothetical protein F5891DRAFT_1130398 [Suillus fuscotomentosus]
MDHQPSEWDPEKRHKLSDVAHSSTSDPLISHGRHFGRTVFALCNYPSLLTNGILRLEQMEETPLEDFSTEYIKTERREHCVFKQLLDSYPGLLERLKNGSEEEILHVGELIGKGAAGARGNNTKTLKSAVLDWISPKGDVIQPHLHRNSKIDRGFNHKLTGSLLCPAGMDWTDPETKENLRSGKMLVCGDQWPIFLYAQYTYDPDDLWCGLLRSLLLAYKHVFTSPSSVEKEPKATRSGNACLHGMNCVTIASISYIATEEYKEVDQLLTWWNRQVFPTSSAAKQLVSANSALSKIRQKRLAVNRTSNLNAVSS